MRFANGDLLRIALSSNESDANPFSKFNTLSKDLKNLYLQYPHFLTDVCAILCWRHRLNGVDDL